MSIIPGRGDNNKTEEEKLRERALIQDSIKDTKIGNQIAAQKQEEQDNTRTQLLDPEKDKKQLKKLLLNVEYVEKPQILYYCNNCGQAHKTEPDKCRNCQQTDFKEKQSGTTLEAVQRSKDSLINKNGFHKVVWSEIEPTISSSVAGGYLKSSEVSKMNYSTLATITMQLALYPWRYNVDNPTDMQQIGDIVRTPLIAHTSKARGGRGLESTEKTLVETVKRATPLGGDEEDESTFTL